MARDVMLSRFNPARDDPETLEAIFVKREPLARAAEDRVADSALTEGKHHLLFFGPRGSGKSHLMALLAHRLAARDDLRDRLRIAWLNEDETTTSFVGLLRRILRALGGRYPDEFPEPEASVLRGLDDPGRVRYLTQRLVDQVSGRTLLVIVENLDELFRGLGEAGQMQWRAFLQERAVAATLATSQQLFDGVIDRKAPFFGFFQRFPLDPFTLDDAVRLLRKIADLRGDAELSAFLGTSTGRDRVRALHHLAGGNPRVFIVLSDFIDRESLDELVGPFEKMIDEMTPYYQARIAWLSPQQREIVEYLCRAPYAVAVKEIADELLASNQTVAGQLQDLRSKGYVRDEALGREKRIELAEPLMRICVEAKEDRRGPARLFIDFLRLWYDRDDLRRRLDSMPSHARLERECLAEALRTSEETSQSVPPSSLDDEAQALLDAGQMEEALPLLETLAFTRHRAADWFRLAFYRQQTGRFDEAIAAYDRALELDPRNIHAWSNRGVTLSALGRVAEALDAFQHALELDPRNIHAWNNRGNTLLGLGRPAEALEAYDRAMAIDPRHAYTWNNRGNALRALNRHVEALGAYDRAMAIDPRHAYTLYNRGLALSVLGRVAEALGAYDRALELDPRNIHAWSNRGVTLSALGRVAEALDAFQHALELDPRNIHAWNNRGNTLLGLGRPAEALDAFEHALAIKPDSPLPTFNRVEALMLLDRWDDAFDGLGRALHLESAEPREKADDVESKVSIVLRSTRESAVWDERVGRLVALYAEVGDLARLGSGLVLSLEAIPGERLSGDGLHDWRDVWRKAGAGHEEMELPLRLFEAGMRFHETGDRRVLLDLIGPERRIVSQALGLEDEEGPGK